MKFLCGRPGCGKESAATLQIDAPSTTVSLVDPRISRDGVPLCARHADATTPPMGWTMNDLRSRSRSLSAVPDEGSVPTSTPPRDRRESEDQAGRRMSRRQSIAERAKQAAANEVDGFEEVLPVSEDMSENMSEYMSEYDAKFASSRPVEKKAVKAEATQVDEPGDRQAAMNGSGKKGSKGPSSRPERRREVPDELSDEEAEENEDRFPWHFQFDDDEPEELQASSPLLSRAFRATTG